MRLPYRAGKGSALTFMLGGIVSSELAWLISLENKRVDTDRKSSAQLAISKNIIERLKAGKPVDVQKELLAANQSDDASLAAILESLEAGDSRWGEARGSVRLSPDDANNGQADGQLSGEASSKLGGKVEAKSKGTWL